MNRSPRSHRHSLLPLGLRFGLCLALGALLLAFASACSSSEPSAESSEGLEPQVAVEHPVSSPRHETSEVAGSEAAATSEPAENGDGEGEPEADEAAPEPAEGSEGSEGSAPSSP